MIVEEYQAEKCSREHREHFEFRNGGEVWCSLCDHPVTAPRVEGPQHFEVELRDGLRTRARAS